LEYLTFTLLLTNDESGEREFRQDLASLIRRLEDRGVTKALKELVIAVRVEDNLDTDESNDSVWLIAYRQEWGQELKGLDALQWSSALQRVQICIENDMKVAPPPDVSEQLLSLVETSLPLLAKRGVLSVRLGTLDEFNNRAWNRAWD
jgi:hypothetical protein